MIVGVFPRLADDLVGKAASAVDAAAGAYHLALWHGFGLPLLLSAVAIAAQGAEAHLVPQSALTLNDDGALGVRLVDADNTARFAPVRLLRDTVQGVWVEGLPAQVDIIVTGQEYVADGVPVIPTYREAQ